MQRYVRKRLNISEIEVDHWVYNLYKLAHIRSSARSIDKNAVLDLHQFDVIFISKDQIFFNNKTVNDEAKNF